VIALMRPPDAAFGEDTERWLARARAAAARGPFGLHTHWTSPTHARPIDGDPAEHVRREVDWIRSHDLELQYFCGGGWYSDAAVREVVRELGLVDCTKRGGLPEPGVLPTTHSLGQLARALAGPLPAYVHAYFHDFELLDARRRLGLVTALTVLGLRRRPGDGLALAR